MKSPLSQNTPCSLLHTIEVANQEMIYYTAQRDSSKGLRLHVNHVKKGSDHYGYSWVETEN